jgi:ABC-type transport system involved in multi-copper enzyme maturation permease subunit
MVMLARLWWKDTRQFWPIWAALAVMALAFQAVLMHYARAEVKDGELPVLALFWTCLYGFAVAAAAFAGERENRTLALLDALPVERWRLWSAKASFALVSTLALAVFLVAAAALGTEKWQALAPAWGLGVGILVLLVVLGWGLIWSAALGNALLAASLAVISAMLAVPGFVFGMNMSLPWGTHSLAHLFIAITTLGASAALFTVLGPPRRPILRRSHAVWQARQAQQASARLRAIKPQPSYGRTAARSLAWQTLRDVLAQFTWLLPIAIVVPAAMYLWTSPMGLPPFWIICNLVVGLVAGVCVFGTENCRRTQAFLANHGVRPGLAWLIKVVVWFTALGVLWSLSGYLLVLFGIERLRGPVSPADFIPVLAGGLFSTASVALLCGMVFRRSITAGVVALLLWWLLVFPLLMLFGTRMLPSGFVLLLPLPILLASYGWSRDWMIERPGAWRWGKLALLLAGFFVVYGTAYATYRAVSVPALDPAVDARIFTFNPPSSVPDQNNAADLYREAGRLNPSATVAELNLRPLTPDESRALDLARQAAARPHCKLVSLDKMTAFWQLDDEAFLAARRVLPYFESSISGSLAKGQLDQAWNDVLLMLRMARHYSGPVPVAVAHNGLVVERTALGLAMRWAADPRQAVDRLHAALQAYQDLPPMPSATEPIRAEALITRNTEALPRAELREKLLALMSEPRKEADWHTKIWVDLMTTPWELARARKASRLLYASAIEEAQLDPWYTGRNSQWNVGGWSKLRISEGPQGVVLAPATLQEIYETTPLTARVIAQVQGYVQYWDRNEVSRRALVYILALRAWQVRHDGKLPGSLAELSNSEVLVTQPTDPYTPKRPFGYIRASGQNVLVLGDLDPVHSGDLLRPEVNASKSHLTDASWVLLYSVGPDLKDDEALMNDVQGGTGDIIFPLQETK